MSSQKDVLLEIVDLKKHFPIRKGFLKRKVGAVKAVDGISFKVYRGETLGVVGESGCGKTTTGRLILRGYVPTAGDIIFQTKEGDKINVGELGGEQLRKFRERMQMIFQDPYASLNPRMTVLDIISEPLVCLRGMGGQDLKNKVSELLDAVGLDPRYANRYPHAFSGGQRQRIGFARALALHPELIVADEPVSALDVSIQAQVINLLEEMQEKFQLTYIFIAHDLSIVEHICDRVAVMYVGKIVELAETEALFSSPKHPYTEALLSAVPRPDPNYQLDHMVLEGEVADPSNRPVGCCFHPRCKYAKAICSQEEPELRDISLQNQPEQFVACHFAEEINLEGVFTS